MSHSQGNGVNLAGQFFGWRQNLPNIHISKSFMGAQCPIEAWPMEAEDENAAQARRWERQKIDSRLKATLRLTDGTSNSVFGRGHSLSPGGLGAYIPAAIAVGEKI